MPNKKPHTPAEFGLTGKFPEGGPVHEDDLGEVRFLISVEDNKVKLDFNTHLTGVMFTKAEALTLANFLTDMAEQIEGD